MNFSLFAGAAMLAGSLALSAQAEAPDGEVVFYGHCASCHVASGSAQQENRAPSVEAISHKTRKAVRAALTTGPMWIIGAELTHQEQEAVVAFLVPKDTPTPDQSANNKCKAVSPFGPNLTQASWNGFGNGIGNDRLQTQTTLNAGNVAKLKLKWAFGIADTGTAFGQPTIIGDRLFFGSGDGTVYSLDRNTGCTIWAFHADTIVRSPVNVQTIGARNLAFFGDAAGNVYAVDAETGKRVWKVHPEEHKTAKITASPQIYKGRVYVGITGGEDIAAAFLKYPCCTFRGSMVALDAATGKQIWKTYTIAEKAHFIKKRKDGVDLFAPGGAGVWVAATIDPARNALYVGTSDCHVVPTADTCDSIMAFDLDNGKTLWHFAGTHNDAFNMGCVKKEMREETCTSPIEDTDFAQPPMIRKLPNGKEVLVVGQKNGVVHALDPDNQGKELWGTKIGLGGGGGGIKWGSSADDQNIYVANVRNLVDENGKDLGSPGVVAVRIADGKIVWRTLAPAPSCKGADGCSAALDATVTLVPGVLFSGSKDGHLRAYATKDGSIIWDIDTAKDFTTVNGVTAKGGSFGGVPGPTIVGNNLYVGSGYGSLAGMQGNALLAFELTP